MIKRILSFIFVIYLAAGLCVGCGEQATQNANVGINGGCNDKADTSALNNPTYLLAGVDDLNRTIDAVTGNDDSKEIGMFYFLWLGSGSGDGTYDVSKVLEKDPDAAQDNMSWLIAGGGPVGAVHWWGESIFGHYFSLDEWVIERDVMMLTDAGVDFLVMDYSNKTAYPDQLFVLLKALDKYYQQGFEVPKVTFITKNDSGNKVMSLYEELYLAHPEYSHLWYQMAGKPMMVGNESSMDLSDECRDYFTFQYAQWPREGYQENGFPWMDFGWWTEDGMPAVFRMADGRTMMSVSVSQHNGTLAQSSSAFYGDTTNHTRNWHDGANDTAEDAYLYGYNFAEQFEYALTQNPDIIFITGWNEWIAGRQGQWNGLNGLITDPVILVDCANIDCSRDIQPMKGGYGDNYYMQMLQYIRRFKGSPITNIALNTAAEVQPVTISVEADTAQWNAVSGYYLDYIYDTQNRKCLGYDMVYKDETGRNDIYKIKLTNDNDNLYGYVQTIDVIQGMDDGHCMTMFISTGTEGNETWCGYDFVVGRTAWGNIEKRTANGWEQVGVASYRMVNNELQFALPLYVLGLSAENLSIQFKFADNYQGEDDVYSFYLNGDCAPYGRLNYVYQSSGVTGLKTFTENPIVAEPDGILGWVKGNDPA